MNGYEDPIDLGNLRKVYFDTSAWNHMSEHPDRAEFIGRIKRSGCIVLGSVISVGEVLRTDDASLRQTICSTIFSLHGDGHILERPQEILAAATEAFVHGDKDMILPRTKPGEWLDSYMRNPLSPTPEDREKNEAWLREMDGALEEFMAGIKPPVRDRKTKYCSPSVLDREDFLGVLCKAPPAQRLARSASQMRQLCGKWDIWRAFAGTLAYVVELSAGHAPNWRKSKKRPGGPDIWQLVYLGVTEAFVTDDDWMKDAARSVSTCMLYPRPVLSLKEFLSAVTRHEGGLASHA